MRHLLLCLAVALCACTGPGPVTENDVHLGSARHISEFQNVSIPGLARISAAAMIVEASESRGYGVKVYVTRFDLNYPEIRSAWNFGRPLDYRRDDHRRVGEARQEAGHIRLTEAAFRDAAQNGLSFKLVGARADYLFVLPARLFAQALTLADGT